MIIEAAAVTLDGLLDFFLRYPNYILFRSGLLSYAVLIKGDGETLEDLTRRGLDSIRSRGTTAGSTSALMRTDMRM